MKGLRETIDSMVEDAIRRILPSVMNEVLIQVVANAGVVVEAPVRRRPGPKPKKKVRQPVREQVVRQKIKPGPTRETVARPGGPIQRRRKPNLSEVLNSIRDEQAGADFYQDPRRLFGDAPHPVDEDLDAYEIIAEEPQQPARAAAQPRKNPVIAQRVAALPPHLQELAEGLDVDDDGGEMWEAGERDSAEIVPAAPGEVRNIDEAAKHAGVDFSRMKAVINVTSPAKRVTQQDVAAKARFEELKIQRMREQLEVKPPS